MKKILSFSLCFILLLLFLLPACNDNDNNRASYNCGKNNKSVIVCIGDSITGDINNGVPPYPTILARMLPDKHIINKGVGGEESRSGAARINNILKSYHPCYIIILFGANDILHFAEPEFTISNLRYIVNSAKNASTIPIIATLTPMIHNHEAFQNNVIIVNKMIRTMALEEDIELIDLANEFNGSENDFLSSDGLHPNAKGAEVIAVACYEKIKP